MKNRIILTGLSLNNDVVEEGCASCDYDFTWVFEHPSTLLWADQILITPSIFSTIEAESWPDEGYGSIAKILKIFFHQAGEEGLIEIKNPKKILTNELSLSIEEQVEIDRQLLVENFSNEIKQGDEESVPGEIFIGDYHYCSPRVLSLYYSIILSRIWDARLLFNRYTEHYLKYKLSLVNKNHISSKYPILNFEEVLREHFPEIDIRPAIGNKSCWNCASLVECDVSQLRDIENSIREMLRWRNYDELIQMKKVFNEVSKKSQNLNDEYDKRQLYKEFKVVEKKLQKKIHNLFPKINRWSSLITMLSIPVIVAGVSSQSPFIAGLGAGVAGVAQSLKSYSDFLSNKLRWLCYRQENRL